jgi:hypothetical protein
MSAETPSVTKKHVIIEPQNIRASRIICKTPINHACTDRCTHSCVMLSSGQVPAPIIGRQQGYVCPGSLVLTAHAFGDVACIRALAVRL